VPGTETVDELAAKIRREQDRGYAMSFYIEEVADMIMDGQVEVYDGCVVEPDGRCPHGHRSPLLVLGMI
jgi:hypothetical protein